MLAVRIGLRSARANAGRFATLVLVGALACGCLLGVVIAPTVKAQEGKRYERITSLDLRISSPLGPRATFAPHRGRIVTLVQVPSPRDGTVIPPGLSGPLPPGSVRLSPALADAVESDPLLATWFPYRRLPTLPIDALSSAGEYKAYIGARADELRRLASGQPDEVTWLYDDHFGYYQWLGFLLFLAMPVAGLLVLASRFGARTRRERYASLRLLGMPVGTCRTALGIETAAPVALGAALAAVLLWRFVPSTYLTLPIVERWVYRDDARLAVGLLIGAWLGVTAFAFVLGGSDGSHRPALSRLNLAAARSRPMSALGITCYTVGTISLVWAWVLAAPRDPRRFIGVVLVGLGSPAMVAAVSSLVGRVLSRPSAPVVRLLALRRLAADARSAARLGGIASVVMFAVTVATPFTQTITEPNSTWAAEARAAGVDNILGRSRSLNEAPLELRGPPPRGTEVVLDIVGVWASRQGRGRAPMGEALVGTCDDASRLLATPLPNCDGTVQRLDEPHEAPGGAEPRRQLELRDDAGRQLTALTVSSTPLRIPYETQVPIPDLLIPTDLVTEYRAPIKDVALRSEADASSWEAAQGWVTGSSPFHLLDNEFDNRAINDSTNNWLLLGFTVASALAAIGALLSALEDRRTHRDWYGLRALGVASSQLASIRLLTSIAVAVVAVAVAMAPAVLVTTGFLRVNGDPLTSIEPFVIASAAGFVTLQVATMLGSWMQLRRRTGS